MSRRFALSLAIIAAVLVALTLSNMRYSPWTNTSARTVEQRGPLSDGERANIELFERVSPSVVQVAAQSAAANPLEEDEGGGGGAGAGAASGTGFVWDDAGHVVTNFHVVQGATSVARHASPIGRGVDGRARRRRAELRPRGAADRRAARAAAADRARQLDATCRSGSGVRDRQPVRARPVADHRHHQRAEARGCRPAAAARSAT